MTYAVHNLHSPTVELIDGQMTHDGVAMLSLPAPLFEAETLEEAEEWRTTALQSPKSRQGIEVK